MTLLNGWNNQYPVMNGIHFKKWDGHEILNKEDVDLLVTQTNYWFARKFPDLRLMEYADKLRNL